MPGVRVNISKRGLSSLSIGRRGLTLNMGRRGTKATVGLPGTGISYTTPVHHLATAVPPHVEHQVPGEHATETTIGWTALIVAAVFVGGLLLVLSVIGKG
jgi:Protein of unknown function (DUF4236)